MRSPSGTDAYRRQNLANWELRVPVHMHPDGYGADALADDPAGLSRVVRPRRSRPRSGCSAGRATR